MKEVINTYKKYWLYVPIKKSYFFLIIFSKIGATISGILIPFTAAGVIKYLTLGYYTEALLWIFYFFLTGTSKYICYYFNYYGGALDSNYCYNILKKKIFSKFSEYDLEFQKTKDIDELLQASSSDVWGIVALNDNLSDVLITLVKIIIVITLTTITSPLVGIIVFVFCSLYIFFTIFFNKKIAKYLNKQRKYQDKIAGIFIEEMNSSEEMKVYGIKDKYKSYFETTNKKFCDNYRLKRRFSDIQENFLHLILELGEVAIYLMTIYLLFKNHYTVDKIVLVIGYFKMLIDDLEYMLVECMQNIINKGVSAERIESIFSYNPNKFALRGKDETDDIEGTLEFKNVSASYLKTPVLKNISFKIRPNEITAIVGRSGSGKTTILNNILRLYKPDAGEILVDGKNVYDYQDDIYKKNVSVVTQKSFLFEMSIRDNLSLVETSHDKQEEICKLLGIHEEILSLPKGYNTNLEENGLNISTRLKQLLSIARSILTKSEILLFDEVTSSLDTNTTKKVINIFRKLAKDHTVIIITHKKEIMEKVDHLIIINKGRKVAEGTPESLQNNKFYLDLRDSSSCDNN